jgi:hypothetical protein
VGDFEGVVGKQSRGCLKKPVSINPEVVQEEAQKKKEKKQKKIKADSAQRRECKRKQKE